jgi:hypothetical protein
LDAQCGLAHNPIGSEIIYRNDLPVPPNGRAQKLRVDHRATVARLYQLGVMDGEGRETLLNLKAIIDERIVIATKERASVPFAVSHRVIQIFINRWTLVSKALDFVANPYNPHGSKVYNAEAELEDRKRKADLASLTMSSPSTLAEEDDTATTQQQPAAAPDNTDRQNPEGSGGNQV